MNHGSAPAPDGPEARAPRTPGIEPPPHKLVLPSERQSAGRAREFAREFIAYHVPGAAEEYVDSVVLIVSELVTNAHRYGTEPDDSLALVLDADAARTRIEVRDPVRRHPRRHAQPATGERGRGLMILDALCPGAWGVTDRPFGKSVWAEIQAPNATTRESGDAPHLWNHSGEGGDGQPGPREEGWDGQDVDLVRPYIRTTQAEPGGSHP